MVMVYESLIRLVLAFSLVTLSLQLVLIVLKLVRKCLVFIFIIKTFVYSTIYLIIYGAVTDSISTSFLRALLYLLLHPHPLRRPHYHHPLLRLPPESLSWLRRGCLRCLRYLPPPLLPSSTRMGRNLESIDLLQVYR